MKEGFFSNDENQGAKCRIKKKGKKKVVQSKRVHHRPAFACPLCVVVCHLSLHTLPTGTCLLAYLSCDPRGAHCFPFLTSFLPRCGVLSDAPIATLSRLPIYPALSCPVRLSATPIGLLPVRSYVVCMYDS